MNIAEKIKRQTDRIMRQQSQGPNAGRVIIETPAGGNLNTIPGTDLAAHKGSGDHDERYAQAFTDLNDVPASYPEGSGGKIIAIKDNLSGLEFITAPSGGGSAGIANYFAEDADNHSGLDFAYQAGKLRNDNIVIPVVSGTVILTDNTSNYIEVDDTGTVSSNTTGYSTGKIPLFQVSTSSGEIATVTDDRSFFNVASGGGSTGYSIGWDVGTLEVLPSIDVPVEE